MGIRTWMCQKNHFPRGHGSSSGCRFLQWRATRALRGWGFHPRRSAFDVPPPVARERLARLQPNTAPLHRGPSVRRTPSSSARPSDRSGPLTRRERVPGRADRGRCGCSRHHRSRCQSRLTRHRVPSTAGASGTRRSSGRRPATRHPTSHKAREATVLRSDGCPGLSSRATVPQRRLVVRDNRGTSFQSEDFFSSAYASWSRVRGRASLGKRLASFAGPRFRPPPPPAQQNPSSTVFLRSRGSPRSFNRALTLEVGRAVSDCRSSPPSIS